MYGASKYKCWYKDASSIDGVFMRPRLRPHLFLSWNCGHSGYGTAFRQCKCLGIPAKPGIYQITMVSDHSDDDDEIQDTIYTYVPP